MGTIRTAKNVQIAETDLYYPIKRLFTRLGYEVKSEVNGCDVTATLDGELVIVEMKLQFNVTLLQQVLERQKLTPLVYAAILRPKNLASRAYKLNCEIAKRLGIGLILVSLDSELPHADIAVFPEGDFRVTRAGKRKRAELEKEAAGRTGDHNVGGSTKRKIVTAYMEKCIKIACALEVTGQAAAPALIDRFGCDKKTNNIMSTNFYGWFERTDKGVYGLSHKGIDYLRQNTDNELVEYYRKKTTGEAYT